MPINTFDTSSRPWLFDIERPVYILEGGVWKETAHTVRYSIHYWGTNPIEAYRHFLSDYVYASGEKYVGDFFRFSFDFIPWVQYETTDIVAKATFIGARCRRQMTAVLEKDRIPLSARGDPFFVRRDIARSLMREILSLAEQDLHLLEESEDGQTLGH